MRMLSRATSFDRILFVADVNIGDAIMIQQSVKVLRYYFQKARIDYLCNKLGGILVAAIPGADHVYPVFKGRGMPTKDDLTNVREIVKQGSYSVIFNLCPFLAKKDLQNSGRVIQLYMPFISYIIRLWKLKAEQLHVSYTIYKFLQGFLAPFCEVKEIHHLSEADNLPLNSFKGNSIYLTTEAIQQAEEFLVMHHLSRANRLLFFNPNAASPYTLIPIELQIQVLKQILESEDIHGVLLGSDHSNRSIERTIIAVLPEAFRNKVVVVPRVPLSVYAALIDACDLFLSSDTGPVHISASWKVALSENHSLRNRTAVVTVFGASDSRMYGYDSEQRNHMPSNQQAPSKVFSALAPCRNITCINKLGKSCKEVRCFHGLRAEEISGYVISYFRKLRNQGQGSLEFNKPLKGSMH